MKYFIKRTAEYTAKNKLHVLLQQNLGRIDCTLYDSQKQAENAVHHICSMTMQEYKGAAARPQLTRRDYSDSGQVDFSICGVHLSLYPVKNT